MCMISTLHPRTINLLKKIARTNNMKFWRKDEPKSREPEWPNRMCSSATKGEKVCDYLRESLGAYEHRIILVAKGRSAPTGNIPVLSTNGVNRTDFNGLFVGNDFLQVRQVISLENV